MKIISKFKDYYDYLQGIWGVDEKRVLDRTTFVKTSEFLTEGETSSIYIGDYLIKGVVKDGHWRFGKDLEPYDVPTEKNSFWERNNITSDTHYRIAIVGSFNRLEYKWFSKTPIKLDSSKSPNTKLNKAILLQKYENPYGESTYDENPILKDYNIQKILPPEEIWLILNDFLGKEKVIENNQTDKEKVIAAGFDTKISFRHRK